MANTPFIIKGNPIDPKAPYQWNEFDQRGNFIRSIETPDVDQETDALSKVISGIPSPFGRLLMFRYALEQSKQGAGKQEPSGLAAFYDQILLEWRALIATIAIFGEKINVQKVPLATSIDKDDPYFNPYELSAGLGTMLFEDRDLWCDLAGAPEQGSDKLSPFIQLIYYQEKRDEEKVLIGGTSPFSLVFTPPRVNWTEGSHSQFFNRNTKRWMDPLKMNLKAEELQKIYDAVSHMLLNLGAFFEKINQERAGTDRVMRKSSLEQHLKQYQKDLERYAAQQRVELNKYNIFTSKVKFASPFDTVFNAESKLFFSYQDGIFYRQQTRGTEYIPVNPSDFLASSSTLVEIEFGEEESADRCASYLLKCGDMYFALPLSELGVCIFEQELSSLLTGQRNGQDDHYLSATQTDDGIRVSLRIKFNINDPDSIGDTDFTEITRIYGTSSASRMSHQKVCVWPDFVSSSWHKYYLYTDLPHQDAKSTVTALPLLGRTSEEGLSLLRMKEESGPSFRLKKDIAKVSDDTPDEEAPKLILKTPAGARMPYEIFESALPFKGVELKYGVGENSQTAGYLLAKALPNASESVASLNVMTAPASLREATVGMDFGSNNTAFSYYINGKELKLIEIINRRRCLMGSDREPGKVSPNPASVAELFFFQKETIEGQVKSMLVAHNEDRMLRPEEDRKQASRAGFPLFENNIPVTGKPNNNQSTNYRLAMGHEEEARLKYNMKWDLDQRENHYKEAFLKTLWLQILAELYTEGYYPNELAWAVPGAMSKSIEGHYRNLWNNVVGDPELYPVVSEVDMTQLQSPISEGEAVARYALNANASEQPGGGLSVAEGGLVIGLDVGGSTTDILIATKGDDDQDEPYSLIKEGSVLLSASAIAQAAIRSKNIQGVIRSFVKNNRKFVQQYGIDQLDKDTTEFHLNALFDRLNAQQLEQLYRHFYNENSKEIFAVAAYVTGAVLFYVGQMVAHVIEHQGIQAHRFALGVYGKGGNIFNWLPAVTGEDATQYYQRCFLAGLNPEGRVSELTAQGTQGDEAAAPPLSGAARFYQEAKFTFAQNAQFTAHREHNKSEVAYGLSTPSKLAKMDQDTLVPEIIGERGYLMQDEAGQPLAIPTLTPMKAEYLGSLGKKSFKVPDEFVELGRFIEVYAKFVKEWKLADYKTLKEGVKALPHDYFTSYVTTLPQYKAARDNDEFDFSASMFVLEAMCLMEQVLLPSLFKN